MTPDAEIRTHSRGETSGTVLDCMNHGLPCVVNAHGSMADVDPAGVWMLPDAFDDRELIAALTTLARDADKRRALGSRAEEIIRTRHSPRRCAEQYARAIERFYRHAAIDLQGLLHSMRQQPLPGAEWSSIANSLARDFPPSPRRRQLLVDVSALVQTDLKSGIQRVVRAILREWLANPPDGFQVEPVYATADGPSYRYARLWTCNFLEIPDDWAEDALTDAWPGDVFIGLDLEPYVIYAQKSLLQEWRATGVKVWFVVYDLLPVLLPQMFPGDGERVGHQRWLDAISAFDGVACISRTVANDFVDWLKTFCPRRERPLSIAWFHMGADVQHSVPTIGIPSDAGYVLEQIGSRPTFLMVGTIEPRKGYLQTLTAFDRLWEAGLDINLVIIGSEGWKPLANHERRDIPETVSRLRTHPERAKRLLWLEGVSDEYLEKIYAKSTCLIASSYGEGFGLPLIEAAHKRLPIIARDISVFREVAGDHAFYFPNDQSPDVIAYAVGQWLGLNQHGHAPQSSGMPSLTWKESAQHLIDITLERHEPYLTWMPDGITRYWGADPRLHTEVGERVSGRDMRTTGRAGWLIYGPYCQLPAGRYRLTLHGIAEKWTGTEFIAVAHSQGQKRVDHQRIARMSAGEWRSEHVFSLNSQVNDFEIQVFVDEKSDILLQGILLAEEGQTKTVHFGAHHEFVILNKSYIKDLEWTFALYRSWEKHSTRDAPFFIVMPENDRNAFHEKFYLSTLNGVIHKMPFLIAEEEVLQAAGIGLVSDLSGWHIQQIIKLCFSKTGIAKNYMTVDSAMIFTRKFDWLSLFRNGRIVTAAQQERKDEFFGNYKSSGENGWLDGRLTNLSDSLNAICEFFGNDTIYTNWYIATSGFFNSESCIRLENFARQRGVDGFAGLIRKFPYEFAIYGEYMYTQERANFHPRSPLMMRPIFNTNELTDEAIAGAEFQQNSWYGFLFQPPSSHSFDPDHVYVRLNDG